MSNCVSTYIEDIVVFSNSLGEQVTAHQRGLKECKMEVLMANSTKCYYGKREAQFLGYLVG